MLLLDTCTLLWLVADQAQLSDRARRVLSDNRGMLFVSAISAFEIGIKHRKGALTLPVGPEKWYPAALEFHGLQEIAVDGHIALESTALPPLHADPCDRIIVATARLHHLPVLTPDELIKAYPDIQVLW